MVVLLFIVVCCFCELNVFDCEFNFVFEFYLCDVVIDMIDCLSIGEFVVFC